jgi:hypothetical protein
MTSGCSPGPGGVVGELGFEGVARGSTESSPLSLVRHITCGSAALVTAGIPATAAAKINDNTFNIFTPIVALMLD